MQQVVAPKGGGYTLLLVAAAALCFAFWLPSNSLILRLYAMVAERSWQQTDAIITSRLTISEAVKYGRLWTPAWKYSYAVNGVNYIGEGPDKSYSYQAHWYRSESNAEQAALVRPVGKRVRVYYDPHEPAHSVLDRPTWAVSDWFDVAVLLFILAAVPDFMRKGRKR
jgi:hypothetical protein